jgi:predicted transcriptional regulator
MSIAKKQAVELINYLPDDCTIEDIQYHLYVIEKVERGIRAIDEGLVVSQEKAEERVREWLRSSGRNRH